MIPEAVRRPSTLLLPLAIAMALAGIASPEGRKLNPPLAYDYVADAGEFVLAGRRVVYRVLNYFDWQLQTYSILSSPLDGLGPTFVLDSSVADLLTPTPDGVRIVYRRGSVSNGKAELYSVPVDGSQPPIRLHRPLVDNEDVNSFEIAPDGRHVVFQLRVKELLGSYRQRLFSVPVDGARPPVLLTPNQQSLRFEIDAASTRVVFATHTNSQLFSVPITGGSGTVALTIPDPLTEIADFGLGSDGGHVVFLLTRYDGTGGLSTEELFSVPMEGGVSAVRLNGPLPPEGRVRSYRISPDGRRVAFAADQVTDQVFGLYSAPIEGGATTEVGDVPGTSGFTRPPLVISPDSSDLVFKAGDSALYVAPLDGSRPVAKLSGALSVGDEIVITPDSARVLFVSSTIWSAPLDASAPPTQLAPLLPNHGVDSLLIPSGSDRVVFRSIGQYAELHSAPVDGSTSDVRLDSTLPSASPFGPRGVLDFACDPATGQVIYRSEEIHLGFIELYRAPIDGSLADVVCSDLRGTLRVLGDVYSFDVTPDQETVVYHANLEAGSDERAGWGTYGVRARDPVESRFIGRFNLGESVGYEFSSDSRRVIVHAVFQASISHLFLMSVPLDGGLGVTLSPPTFLEDVLAFAPTPDSAQAVFTFWDSDPSATLLYSSRVDGSSTPLLLTPAPWAGNVGTFRVTPDSQRVVFLGSPGRGAPELHRVPISGQSAPERLSAPLAPGELVTDCEVSPDGRRVVYLVVASGSGDARLVSVSIGGGPVSELCAPLGPGSSVSRWQISPDSSRVVFLANRNGISDLFSIPIDRVERRGRAAARAPAVPVELTSLDSAAKDVREFQISPDSTRVVFLADMDSDDVVELFSVPITGGRAPVKLDTTPVPGGDVDSFRIAAGSERVVYVADQDSDEVFELFSTPIDGGARALVLSVPLRRDRDVSTQTPFQLDPTGRWVLYNADAETDEVHELYIAPIDNRLPSRRVNGRLLSASPRTVIGKFAAEGVVYLAEEDIAGADELFFDDLVQEPPRLRPAR